MKPIAGAVILTVMISSLFAKEESVLKKCAFIILSQPNSYHAKLAYEAKSRLIKSLAVKSIDSSFVYVAHEDIHSHGAWTIYPLLSVLLNRLKVHAYWYVFLDPASHVNVDNLENLVANAKHHFIGYALKDKTHTVIHHFKDPKELQYPDFEAGFMLSIEAAHDIALELDQHGVRSEHIPKDFSIDAQYELAKTLSGLHSDYMLQHEPQFCIEMGDNCAIYPVPASCNATDDSIIDLSTKTLFAVKTCLKFHEERLPVIKETWAKAAPNIILVSELEDAKVGTIRLENLDNTEQGHCAKTMAILKYFGENAKKNGWSWLVIADDDTILGVHKMLEHLHCYKVEEPIHLGQRYGFRTAHGRFGYDYITGGGGMVFSLAMAEEMLSEPHCKCSRPDAPDDMHLGACVSNLGRSLVHSSKFHQARPEDYSDDLLKHQDPVSFHKFWNTDPLKTYQTWFAHSDLHLREFKYNLVHPHQEL